MGSRTQTGFRNQHPFRGTTRKSEPQRVHDRHKFPHEAFFYFIFLNTVKLREMERSRQRKFHPLGLNTGSQVGPWSTRRVGVGGCTQDVAAAATAAAVAECWQ